MNFFEEQLELMKKPLKSWSLTPSGWGYKQFIKYWCSKPRRKKGKR